MCFSAAALTFVHYFSPNECVRSIPLLRDSPLSAASLWGWVVVSCRGRLPRRLQRGVFVSSAAVGRKQVWPLLESPGGHILLRYSSRALHLINRMNMRISENHYAHLRPSQVASLTFAKKKNVISGSRSSSVPFGRRCKTRTFCCFPAVL